MRQRGKTLGTCEFRRDGHSYVYDYGSLCGAGTASILQQLLVADLIDALRGNGGQIRFVTPAAAIHLRDRPVIELVDGHSPVCDIVLDCDGFPGSARPRYPSWAIAGLISAPSGWPFWPKLRPALEPHQLYGLHRDGFAGHMHRTAMVSRFYLQVPPGTPPDLDDEDIWAAPSAVTQPYSVGRCTWQATPPTSSPRQAARA